MEPREDIAVSRKRVTDSIRLKRFEHSVAMAKQAKDAAEQTEQEKSTGVVPPAEGA